MMVMIAVTYLVAIITGRDDDEVRMEGIQSILNT